MKTEVRKRLATCLMLWAAFVLIKWIMLLSPSSILSMLGPFMVIFRDGYRNYEVSGWIALGIETALTGLFFLVRVKKITPLYLLCMVYSLFYIPAVFYWIIKLEFEPWRYTQFAPAVLCSIFMLAGCTEYIKQEKLKKPKKAAEKPDGKTDEQDGNDSQTKENENGSSDE